MAIGRKTNKRHYKRALRRSVPRGMRQTGSIMPRSHWVTLKYSGGFTMAFTTSDAFKSIEIKANDPADVYNSSSAMATNTDGADPKPYGWDEHAQFYKRYYVKKTVARIRAINVTAAATREPMLVGMVGRPASHSSMANYMVALSEPHSLYRQLNADGTWATMTGTYYQKAVQPHGNFESHSGFVGGAAPEDQYNIDVWLSTAQNDLADNAQTVSFVVEVWYTILFYEPTEISRSSSASAPS